MTVTEYQQQAHVVAVLNTWSRLCLRYIFGYVYPTKKDHGLGSIKYNITT